MTALDDFSTLVRSLQRSMWRRSGQLHRARLLVSRQYIKTSNRKARP